MTSRREAAAPTAAKDGAPYCRACGYDFTGLTESSKCPECGRPLVEVLMRRGTAVANFGKRYRSKATMFGLPVIDVALGPRDGELRGKARGIIAIGDVATGGLAVGGMAFGVVAIGGMALGFFAAGGMAVGLIVATGGMAVGGMAAGGGAAGVLASGGGAAGVYAQGGAAFGAFTRDAFTRRGPGAVDPARRPRVVLRPLAAERLLDLHLDAPDRRRDRPGGCHDCSPGVDTASPRGLGSPGSKAPLISASLPKALARIELPCGRHVPPAAGDLAASVMVFGPTPIPTPAGVPRRHRRASAAPTRGRRGGP